MRILSDPLLNELSLTVTRPGYLIRLGFSTDLYLSTMGDISWDGHSWTGTDVKVSGLGQDGKGSNQGTLELGNTDNAFGALVLNEGTSDVPVQIWACYAGATAAGDPAQVFDGVADGAEVGTSKVSLTLVEQGNKTLYSPRLFINKASGFNFLQPVGTKISVNGEVFILERK